MTAEDRMTRAAAICLSIVGICVALLILACVAAFAHDHNNPGMNDWLKSLNSKGGAWCCDGNDTDQIESWDTKAPRGGYRVKFRGQWFDVPESALVDGPNKGGGALLWMNKGYSGMSVRCFMPGTMG